MRNRGLVWIALMWQRDWWRDLKTVKSIHDPTEPTENCLGAEKIFMKVFCNFLKYRSLAITCYEFTINVDGELLPPVE
jgi:hypothetical protein